MKGLTEEILKVFNNRGIIDFKYSSVNKIQKLIRNMKDKIELNQEKNVVCEVACLHCDQIYVGHMDANIKNRIYDQVQHKIGFKM